jgi:hypothetical protein
MQCTKFLFYASSNQDTGFSDTAVDAGLLREFFFAVIRRIVLRSVTMLSHYGISQLEEASN